MSPIPGMFSDCLVFPQLMSPLTPLVERVTLIVYGWQSNQPGTLAWVFPTLGSAVRAIRALRNAVRWVIVAGDASKGAYGSIDELRSSPRVLLERMA